MIRPPNPARSVFSCIIELIPGEGGTDSKLLVKDFAAALRKNFDLELLHEGSSIVFASEEIAPLKFLAGNHVVQRVPPTERSGRMHTSIIGIAVYEIPEISREELDVEFSYCHTKIKAGGQNSNKVQSTVRAKDKKTGITVRIDGRDQHKNKKRAKDVLQEKVQEVNSLERFRKIRQDVLSDIRTNSRGCKDFTWSFRDDFVVNHKTGCKYRDLKGIFRDLRQLS